MLKQGPPLEHDYVGDGRGCCYVYAFPCTWEDHCKLGFSRDPLSRIQSLHHRYYEFFELDRGWLVETETVRDARDLELELRRALIIHNAPAPLAVRCQAGGHTEWYRGAEQPLAEAVDRLQLRGHVVHAPLRSWLRLALLARRDQLYAWSQAQWAALDRRGCPSILVDPVAQLMRDTLDAFPALALDLTPWLPPEVADWYLGERQCGLTSQ